MKKYQICKKCVIDNLSYRNVEFDEHGVCAYCTNFQNNIEPFLIQNKKSKNQNINFKKNLNTQNNKDYDCLIGVSGGVDSSYLVYHAVENLKLNPILYHVDTGWNNAIAVSNIEKLIDKYNIDLYTEVIDWNEMKDLCRSFLFAQVPYMESIQDHAIWAGMHIYAKNNGIRNILTGGNLQTESYRPPLYIAYYAGDLLLLRDIQKKFGTLKLEKFPTLDILIYKIWYRYFYGIKLHEPLNYVNYNKNFAIKTLIEKIDWKNYGDKHHESNFTKFFDGYWKPRKFNHDSRKGQLSSLIATNQITRDQALESLKKNYYDSREKINKDFSYISSKLGFTVQELENILDGECKYYYDYRSKFRILKILKNIMSFLKIESRNIV